jgi:hypothetical protein
MVDNFDLSHYPVEIDSPLDVETCVRLLKSMHEPFSWATYDYRKKNILIFIGEHDGKGYPFQTKRIKHPPIFDFTLFGFKGYVLPKGVFTTIFMQEYIVKRVFLNLTIVGIGIAAILVMQGYTFLQIGILLTIVYFGFILFKWRDAKQNNVKLLEILTDSVEGTLQLKS